MSFKAKKYFIEVNEAIEIPTIDFVTIQPYVVLSCGSQRRKTKVLKKSKTYLWDQILEISVQKDKEILLEVYNKNLLSEDTLFGYCYFKIKEETAEWFELDSKMRVHLDISKSDKRKLEKVEFKSEDFLLVEEEFHEDEKDDLFEKHNKLTVKKKSASLLFDKIDSIISTFLNDDLPVNYIFL
jgi:hypothetical protein